ncbi:class I SAM-dependent methyltransferase [Pseudomonas veronii]|uniref:class I SAM-dependent methyltransferase n=1 Tax=Pseudomonas TaxID=286 RepID=UPI000F816F19|nr:MULTISPECIES: class I SAM-dependent methyltransferase [Pseudomonas]MDY7552276.1 class I SAM-dependent methyltransferase [Pseudomonas sp. FG1]MEB0051379.1 class I SAM-dependent methyltransferase [Pseudomonas sp. FG1]RTY61672.1 class I SAM-dependent methyltransferase [Pseudomonas veronii]
MEIKDYWENVYSTKPTESVSWYQEHASTSLRLIQGAALQSSRIIDVGGGASTLADDLILVGFRDVTVLDLSAAALAAAKGRLGDRADSINWIVGDILTTPFPQHTYDVWHDRAVFHFLTEDKERRAYVSNVLKAVRPGGIVIVATFAEDGPTQCSGLPVKRYSSSELHEEFGAPFELLGHETEEHHTPLGTVQSFVYCYCKTAS